MGGQNQRKDITNNPINKNQKDYLLYLETI